MKTSCVPKFDLFNSSLQEITYTNFPIYSVGLEAKFAVIKKEEVLHIPS
jgi:hypothetical protein